MSSTKTSTAGNSGIWLSQTAASRLTDESIKWEERKPLGVRFNPSDEVLAGTFLTGKVFGPADNPVFKFFKDINIYEHEPSILSGLAHDFGEGKMYFFTTIKAKYPNAARKYSDKTKFDREAPGGRWVKTGGVSFIDVMGNDVPKLRVTKTSLAFHSKDKNSGEQDEIRWLMKEYMLDMKSSENLKMKDPLVLCVVYNRNDVQDKVVESSQILATQASSSLVPPTQNTNPDCRQNLRKRRRLPSNPQFDPASSNPAAILVKGFPSSYQMPVMASQGAPNPYEVSFGTQESGQFQNIASLVSNQSHFVNHHHQQDQIGISNLKYPSMNADWRMFHNEPSGLLMLCEFQAKDRTIGTSDPDCDLEQFVPPGGSMVPTLPTASVSAATNVMSQSLSEFYDLLGAHLQAEAPLLPPLEEGQSIQHHVAQDEGRTENAGYAKSSWSIHGTAVDQPSHPIDLTESGMSDQSANRFDTFGLPCSELESARTMPINVPPSMGRAAPFSALADPAFATKPWCDIYWENTPADHQDPMAAQHMPPVEPEKNFFNLAEQPLSKQLQHQQLQQPNMFSHHARLNESVIVQEPCQSVIPQQLLGNNPLADLEHLPTFHLQQQRQIQLEHHQLQQQQLICSQMS